MITISPPQAQTYINPGYNINSHSNNQEFPFVYLDYSSGHFNPHHNPVSYYPDSYSKSYIAEINPQLNNLQNDPNSISQNSSNISYSNNSTIQSQMIPRQTIQASLFSCKQHKTKWTYEEDVRLKEAVEKFGTDSWIRISQFVPGRNSKQCRERWMGQLAPTIRKESWSREEDEILMHQHELIGNKWTAIATFLPGRSAINVKNRWSKIKRIKDDILTNGDSGSPSSKSQSYNDAYFSSCQSLNSLHNDQQLHKKNLYHHKKSASKAHKFKHSKVSGNLAQKPKIIEESLDFDENNAIDDSQNNNNNNLLVIKEKLPSIVFEFPSIHENPLFGQDFAIFQAQMLK